MHHWLRGMDTHGSYRCKFIRMLLAVCSSVESRYCQNVTPVPPDLSTLIPCRPDMSTRLCPADVKNFSLKNYYNMAK